MSDSSFFRSQVSIGLRSSDRRSFMKLAAGAIGGQSQALHDLKYISRRAPVFACLTDSKPQGCKPRART